MSTPPNGLEISALGGTAKVWGNTVILVVVMVVVSGAVIYVLQLGIGRIVESNKAMSVEAWRVMAESERVNSERHLQIVESLRRQSCGLWYSPEERTAIRKKVEEYQSRGGEGKVIFELYCP